MEMHLIRLLVILVQVGSGLSHVTESARQTLSHPDEVKWGCVFKRNACQTAVQYDESCSRNIERVKTSRSATRDVYLDCMCQPEVYMVVYNCMVVGNLLCQPLNSTRSTPRTMIYTCSNNASTVVSISHIFNLIEFSTHCTSSTQTNLDEITESFSDYQPWGYTH
jgi:hypothetical protein